MNTTAVHRNIAQASDLSMLTLMLHPARSAQALKHRVGATLMEIAFVLLVIVGLIAGALAMANSVLGQNTVTQETQVLNNLASSVMRTKGANGFDTATNAIVRSMDQMNLIPSNVARTGTGASIALRNGWSGNITIQATNGGGSFSITYTAVPQADCTKLVQSVKAGLMQSVNSGTSASGGYNLQALTAANISAVCPSTSNTITWDSSLL